MSKRLCDIVDVVEMIESSRNLSENTRTRYKFSLEKVAQTNPKRPVCELLVNSDATFAKLRRLVKTSSTLQTIMIGILYTIRSIEKKFPTFHAQHAQELKKWYALSADLAKRVRSEKGKNRMSPKQKLAHVPWKRVIAVRNGLAKEDPGGRAHLLLCMYTMLPPRRQMDYYRIKLFEGSSRNVPKDCSGFIENLGKNSAKIHITQFKTVKYMEPWSKVLPQNLVRVIRHSLEKNPREYLFDTEDGPFSSVNTFTQFSNRILKTHLGKHCTVNSLRHSYATHVYETGSKNLDDIARDMAHSVNMHRSYVFID